MHSVHAGLDSDRDDARPGRAESEEMRSQQGVTLTAVAEVAGISKSTQSRLETGQRRPSYCLGRYRVSAPK